MGEKSVKGNKLLIMIIVFLVIIAATIFVNFVAFSRIDSLLIDQMTETQLVETEHAAHLIESHINQVKDELITISKFPLVETLNISECSGNMEIIHDQIQSKIDSLLRADMNGNVIECSSEDFSHYLGLNIKNTDYFKVPEETNEPYISGIVSQGTNKQVIVSTPLFETSEYTPYPNFLGEFDGVLFSVIEMNKLHNLYLHPVSDPSENFFLLVNMDDGETILKSDDIQEYSELRNMIPEGRQGSNTVSGFGVLDRTIITSSNIIFGRENWRLIVLTPLANVRTDIAGVQTRNIFSLGFVLVVIVGMSFLFISLYKSKEEVASKLEKTSVTLEKLGISVGVEEDKFNQADIVLDAKKVYLVKDEEENHSHELFISSLNRGFAGLGIVRDDPIEVKKKYNLQKTSFIWLTNTKSDGVACESDINNLFGLISEFVKQSKKSVILIDRMDYILSENDFESVVKSVNALRDLVRSHNCIVIISANPELIEDSKLKAIEAETIDLYGKHLKKKVDLPEMEMNILKYVNEQNITNRMVSYKHITDNFKITKPTTRAKIRHLQEMGLLQVEQKGRFKSLKITSSGRRILG